MAAEKPEDPLGSYPKRPRLGSEIVKMTGKPVSPEGEVSESLDRNNSDHKTSSTLSENISVTGAGELHQSTQQFPYSTSSSNTEPTEGPDPIPTVVRPNVIISEEVPGTEDTSGMSSQPYLSSFAFVECITLSKFKLSTSTVL